MFPLQGQSLVNLAASGRLSTSGIYNDGVVEALSSLSVQAAQAAFAGGIADVLTSLAVQAVLERASQATSATESTVSVPDSS